MASGAYAQGITDGLAGSIDYDADTIKVMAVQAGYTLDKEAHTHLDDVVASRYTGTTDQTLGDKTNVVDTGNNRVEIGDGTGVTFSSVAIDGTDDVIGFIIYKDTGTPSTSPLIAFDDLDADVTPDGNNINYTPDAEGIVQYSYGA